MSQGDLAKVMVVIDALSAHAPAMPVVARPAHRPAASDAAAAAHTALASALHFGDATAIESAYQAYVNTGHAPQPVVLLHLAFLYAQAARVGATMRVLTRLHALAPLRLPLVSDLISTLTSRGHLEAAMALMQRLQDAPFWPSLVTDSL